MFANKLFYIRGTIARRSNRRTRIGIIIAETFAWIDKGAKAQTRVASFPHVVRTTACARSLIPRFHQLFDLYSPSTRQDNFISRNTARGHGNTAVISSKELRSPASRGVKTFRLIKWRSLRRNDGNRTKRRDFLGSFVG